MTSRKLTKKLVKSLFVGVAFVFLSAQAWAWTPAGTEIRNQSVATYRDINNQPQISTSNEVINIVDKIYGLEITPDKKNGTGAPFTYTDDPALEQTTAPGNVAYFHYYLKNTGNTPDTYNLTAKFDTDMTALPPNGVEVYYDANGNGQVDAGDILLYTVDNAGLGTHKESTPLVAQDAIIPLIVAVKTPTNATTGQQINTDIDGESVGGPGTKDAISNWNRTLFSSGTGILTATKAANVSTAKPGDTLTYTIEGSNTGSAAVYGIVYSAGAEDAIDLTGDGNAEAREGILIIDELDPNKLVVDATYVKGGTGTYGYTGILAPSVSGPLKARIVYWHENQKRWHITADNAQWSTTPKIALFIPDTDSVVANDSGGGASEPVLAPGQGYKFSFQIKVQSPYDPAEPKLIENYVESTYGKDSNPDNTATVKSNKSLVTIGVDPLTATPGVAIGPFGYPKTNTTTNEITLDANNHPAITKPVTILTGADADKTTARECNAGQLIVFPLTILNPNEALTAPNGIGGPATAADIYNISYVNPDSGSFSVVLYKGDGMTPLADTNGDGKPDTGAIAPAGEANIIVKVYINAGAQLTNTSTFDIIAESVNAAAANNPKIDHTYLVIDAVNPAGVDIATATDGGQLGKGDNATQPDATAADDDDVTAAGTNAVDPGADITFKVQVGNMRPIGQTDPAAPLPAEDELTSVADTYQLSYAKIGPVASTFIVSLHKADEHQISISDTGWLPAITSLDPISTTGVFNMDVRVQVPVGTPKGTYYIDVKATSTNNSAKFDTMRLAIEVKDAPSIEITPDNTATVVAGGSYIFSHVVTNTGNQDGPVTLIHSDLPNGYSAVWVNCTNGAAADGATGTGTNADPSKLTITSLAASASINVCLKVFVPANAPAGSVVPITVKATLDVANPPSDTALDIITVIDGSLQLTKSNSPTTAVPPGENIIYTTAYKNLSPGELTNAIIADAIPANTVLTGTADQITAKLPDGTTISADSDTRFEYSLDGGVTWSAFPASNFANVTNVRVNIGVVPAGEGGNFVFTVKVK